MEGGQGEDTAVQADYTHGPEPEVPGAAGDCHSDCAAMAVHGQRRQRSAEVRAILLVNIEVQVLTDPPDSTASALQNRQCE